MHTMEIKLNKFIISLNDNKLYLNIEKKLCLLKTTTM